MLNIAFLVLVPVTNKSDTLIFARVGWLLASSGVESVITKPAIDFVNVSVRTALFPALSVAVIVIVCWAFVSAVKVFPETESVCVAPNVIAFFVAIVFPSIFSTTFTVSPSGSVTLY